MQSKVLEEGVLGEGVREGVLEEHAFGMDQVVAAALGHLKVRLGYCCP